MKIVLQLAAAVFCSLSALAADTAPPTVISMTPPPGTTLSSLSQINVVFSEPVVGVFAWELQVNGMDAAGVTGIGFTNFTFSFTQPAPGTVTLNWDGAQGITDQSGNIFQPSIAWQYTLLDTLPPAVVTVSPDFNAIVGNLTQVAVTFSEPVLGLKASDLWVNSDPATTVSGTAAGPYLFQFTHPTAGTVVFSWAPGNGITDMASNALAAGTWTNTLDPTLASVTLRINEFLSANVNTNTGLRDEFKNLQEWIELYNYGAKPVNLTGFSLTDDPTDPGRWIFPNLSLPTNSYLVVFASGLDRRVVGGTNRLHTNFKLSPYGGFLGLYNAESPRGALTALDYPIQKAEYSYGLDRSNQWRYFSIPTPGTVNGTSSITGMVAEVHFSAERGFFDTPFTLLFSSPTPGATIRYTTNGSIPTESIGSVYTNALTIDRTATLRAVAFFTNMLPSVVQTHTYIFPDSVLQQPNNPAGFPVTTTWSEYGYPSDYGMDPKVVTNALYSGTIKDDLMAIPSLSVVMNVDDMFGGANGIYTHATSMGPAWERPCSVELINPDGTKGFQCGAGIKMHGGGSRARTLKHPMRLVFKGKYGANTLQYQFFPDSPVTQFDVIDLRSEYNNHWNHGFDATQRSRGTMVRDPWYKDVHGAMGNLSGHSRFVHLYINGLYWGVYGPCERVDASFGAAYLGGDKEEYDAVNGTGGQLIDGTSAARSLLLGISNLGNPAQYELMKQNLDITQYIDYMILQIYGANEDWGTVKNWYALRRRQPGSTWKYMCWDDERTLEGTNDLPMGVSGVSSLNSVSPDGLQAKLVANPEYRLAFADRIYEHFFNDGFLTLSSIQATWNARAVQVDRAIVGESARWGDMMTTAGSPGKTAMSPYPGYTAGTPYTRNENWVGEQYRLFNNYFPARGAIVLNQFRTVGLYPNVEPPSFSQHGGRVTRGFTLSMTATNPIYFTTNGADPRVYGSGVVAATAVLYTDPLVIGATMVVKARALSGTNWSALHEATFTIGELLPPLRITEIMYNPIGGDNYEFIELQNIGTTPLDLSNYRFDGITYQFPVGASLNPGERMVLGSNNDTNAWQLRYPGVAVAGWFGAKLANTGEPILIYNASNQVVLLVDYKTTNGWPTLANGAGYSLEIINPEGDPNDPANWQASASLNGTPGLGPTPAPPPGKVLLNEVMADNLSAVAHEGTFPDWLELFNSGSTSVDLFGWSLTDDGNPRKFVFTNSTILEAGGYLVVWCDSQTNTTPGWHAGFALNRDGESLFLYDPNTNRIDAISFGAQVTDYSLGRVGGDWLLTLPTPNDANQAALLSPPSCLIINEWMANSAKGGSDWLELFNTNTVAPVALRDIYVGTSNALCQIKTLSFLAPGGFLQLLADSASGANHLDFKLPAEGGFIALYDETGFEIPNTRVTYGPQVESVSQGRLPDGFLRIVPFPGSASPGAPNYLANYTGPILNEVLANHYRAVVNPRGHVTDWVELYNSSTTNCLLTGWSLSIDKPDVGQWYFPNGTVLYAQSYLVVWCDGDRPPTSPFDPPGGFLNSGKSINTDSGSVYFYNAARQLIDSVEFGFQVEDKSIGRSAGSWQLLSSPTPGSANLGPAQLGSVANLRLNEWMAAPPGGDDWIELYNLDTLPVSLGGLYLSDDPSLVGRTNFVVAPLSFIAGNGFAKWVADGNPSKGRDHLNFNLDRLGESLSLYQTNVTLIDRVNFGSQSAGVSQGRLPDGAANVVAFPETPTPGKSNYLPLPNALINELLTHATAPKENAVELFNPSSIPTPLAGWFLSDGDRNFRKYRIPNSTLLDAGGFLVVYQSQFNSTNAAVPFTLDNPEGGVLWLSQADGLGQLTGYRAHATFGPADPNVSFGRWQTSIGVDYPALTQTTFGADTATTLNEFRLGTGGTNASVKVGPVVVNEIMYHPPDIGGTNDNVLDEYIELFNFTGTDVRLYDQAYPTNSWRLQSGVEFSFPPNTVLSAGSYLLVVNFDPATNLTQLAAFQAKYGITGFNNIYGPYRGHLGNDGEEIVLAKPGTPTSLPPAPEVYVPFIVIDRLVYGDSNPWPSLADGNTNGLGMSLQRRNPTDYGNEPLNWFAGVPNPGLANGVGGSLPVLVQQPQDAQVGIGSNFTFSVLATGEDPLSYLWEYNGIPMLEATNSSFTLYNAQPADEGLYTVLVSGSGGAVRSTTAKLLVMNPPRIIYSPQSQGGTLGATVNFAVVASGGALTYQWLFNGAILSYETNATLARFDVVPSDAGAYSVVVSNALGKVTSDVAYLVLVPPSILSQPQGFTNTIGSSFTLTVVAAGDAPLSYQWRKDGIPIFGQTNSTLLVTSALAYDAGNYDVVVANPVGSAISAGASVGIYVPVQVTDPPSPVTVKASNQSATYGQTYTNVTFTFSSIGSLPVTYQWQKNGVNIPGATGTLLALSNVTLADEGYYAIVLRNNYSSITSTPARLMVAIDPVIRQQPLHQTLTTGSVVTFSVVVGGNPMPLGYRWKKDGGPVANGYFYTNSTNCTLTLSNVTASLSGGYTVTVTNSAYSTPFAISPNAYLTVVVPPTNQVVPAGTNATFSVTANCGNSTSRLRYQWQFNGVNLDRMTNSTFTITNVQDAKYGLYTVQVINLAGYSADFSAGLLPVSESPVIVVPPSSQTVTQGTGVTFSVLAGGRAPLWYQWLLNGSPLPNATNATLTLPEVQALNQGSYSVCVTNLSGSVTSSPAILTLLLEFPVISAHPQDQLVNPGDTATFSVSATGIGFLSYEWLFNGSSLPGATNPIYTCPNVQYTNAGSYIVRVSNSGGMVESNPALLNVRPRFLAQSYSNGVFHLDWQGVLGKTFAIESATGVTNWVGIGLLSNTSVQMHFQDTNAALRSNSLYRLRQTP